jgi:multidrug transporter EmrE-like cation transporter
MTYSQLLPFWGWLALSILFYAFGEFLSKKWALTPSISFASAVAVSYALCGLAWIPLVQLKGSLALAGAIWLVSATVVTILLGVLIFHEPITRLQATGLVLAIAALLLLELGR